MTSKDPKEAVNSYLTDMLSLERHIRKALDGQISDHKDKFPQLASELERVSSTIEFHISALEGVSNSRGAKGVTGAIKEAGSALLGLGASAVNIVRNEGAPKSLRDDFAACSLATISYVMLHTTALSLGDQEVASLAHRHLSDYAKITMDLQNIIPAVTVRFLQDEGLRANESVLTQVSNTIDEVWHAQHRHTSVPSGMGR
jgi:ferritin-like metal-binding protein YciE